MHFCWLTPFTYSTALSSAVWISAPAPAYVPFRGGGGVFFAHDATYIMLVTPRLPSPLFSRFHLSVLTQMPSLGTWSSGMRDERCGLRPGAFRFAWFQCGKSVTFFWFCGVIGFYVVPRFRRRTTTFPVGGWGWRITMLEGEGRFGGGWRMRHVYSFSNIRLPSRGEIIIVDCGFKIVLEGVFSITLCSQQFGCKFILWIFQLFVPGSSREEANEGESSGEGNADSNACGEWVFWTTSLPSLSRYGMTSSQKGLEK